MKNRLGGLAKRAQYIATHRKEAQGALLVDAGNLFVYRKKLRPKPGERIVVPERLRKRAALLAEVYGRMQFHGVTVGGLDLALGVDTLRDLARTHRLPLLSANLLDAAGKRVFPAHRVVTVAGVRFGIFGLSGPHRVFAKSIELAPYRLGDPVAAAKAEVQALRKQGAQVIVALAAIGDLPARKVADEVPGIHFLFISGTGRHRPNLEKRGTAYLSEMMPQGKYIGHMTLVVRKGGFSFQDVSQRFVIASRIQQIEKGLAGLRARLRQIGERAGADYLRRRLQRQENSLVRLRQQLYTANQQQPGGSYVYNVMVPCDVKLPEDPVLAKLIATRAQAAGLERPRGAH